MLQQKDLESNFSGVTHIGQGVFRCEDVLPKTTFYYYVKIGEPSYSGDNFLLVSENMVDDDFALAIILQCSNESNVQNLELHQVSSNKYGFSSVLLAPKNYHSYFKGRLDEKRDTLVFCMPMHRCEFSGDESIEEFYVLRREVVPTLNWAREVHPKIEFRFDNPKTQASTGASYVFAKYEMILREVSNLDGVPKGFIEIMNYKHQVIEILSPRKGAFHLIKEREDRNKVSVDLVTLQGIIKEFLVNPN